MPIENVIICSTSKSFSLRLIEAIKTIVPKPIVNVISFDFTNIQARSHNIEHNIYINKLIMNIFAENIIKETIELQ